MNEFACRLKQLREQANMTQDELAAELGVTSSEIETYELSGSKLDAQMIECIASCFNVSTDYLLGHSSDPVNYDDPELIASIPLSYMELFNNDVEAAYKYTLAVDDENT